MARISAGLLVFRLPVGGKLAEGLGVEFFLVHPGGPFWAKKDEHAWSLPKGEHEEGDDPLGAAEREFLEEVGVPAPPGQRLDLGTVRQSGGKVVRAFAVRADDFDVDVVRSNEFEMEWPPRSGRMQSFPEVDRAEWMDLSQARRRAVKAQGELFDRVLELLGDKEVDAR